MQAMQDSFAMPSPLHPLFWTCVDISTYPASPAIKEYLPSMTLPANTVHNATSWCQTTATTREETDKGNTATAKHHTIYGPGELELYRHIQLVQNAKDAKLKIWYPGSWMHHARRAYFRTRIGGANATKVVGINIDGRDEFLLLNFRSNARIISAHCIIDAEDDNFECSDDRTTANEKAESLAIAESHPDAILASNGIVSLRWKSTTIPSNCSEELVHDHVILAPAMQGMGSQNDSMHGSQDDEASPSLAMILELDTSQTADVANLKMTTALDYPPPCVSWELRHPTTDHCNWEWKGSLDEDWIPINSLWLSPKREHTNIEKISCDKNLNEVWHFPHQKDLCQVYTVSPVHQIRDIGITNKNEQIHDFGKELLGKVQISIIGEMLTSPQPTVLLRVGETLAEAMNEDEESFEQCVDVCNCTHEHDMAGETCGSSPCAINNDGCEQHDSIESNRHWISCHLLAFRYVRVILLPCNGHHLNVSVTCKVHTSLLQQRGSFACSEEGSSTATSESPNLDTKIWQTAAYTLQLCIHQNFIIDGIKRDRLPWMGDLAISLMASAYTFRDEESVRWTLRVLGRCGANNLSPPSDFRTEEEEEEEKASIATSHVNGIVDYSLWYFVCHWLYQRYFGDIFFLLQEWRLIEQRLSYLLLCCSDEETGMYIINDNDCLFIDWNGDRAEKSRSVQILWWYALNCAISLAQKVVDQVVECGQHECMSVFITMLSDRQSKLENSYLQMNDIQYGFSRHSHILGVVSNLYKRLDDRASEGDWSNPDSSDGKWQTVRRCRILHDRSRIALMSDVLPEVATPYMKHLEMIAICALGERKHALESIRSYWGGMIDADASTFFEAFDEKEKPSEVCEFYNRRFGRSLCHAWAAGPCALYPEVLLGLRPLSDGWKEWLCDPLQCLSTSVSASIHTKYGVIDVKLDTDYLHVFVPKDSCMILMGSRYSEGSHHFSRNSLISSQDVHDWSMKYRGWQYYAKHVINPDVTIHGFEGIQMTDVPTVYQLPEDDLFYISFIGFDGVGYQSFIAESTDLVSWTNVRLAMGYGEEGTFDFGGVVLGAYLYESYNVDAPRVLKQVNGKFFSLYGSYAKKNTYEPDPGFQGLASSKDGLVWEREKNESILSVYGPGMVKEWEKDSIYQPWLVYHDDKYFNFYNAKKMPEWIEQIGLATSKDLYTWARYVDNPVLCVSERDDTIANDGFDTQFVADAKVFRDISHWIMFYFGVGKGGAHIMVAFSKDLIHWVRDPIPLYTAGANPSGLDKQYAHKISIVWNPEHDRWHMFYCAVGDAGRGIGMITSRCPSSKLME